MSFVGFAFLLDRYDETNPASLAIMWRQMSGQNLRHEWVPLRSISPALLRAVVAAEDGRFCVHRGVDWSELRAVIGQDGGPRRGASTITMQTARNLFLWQSRSYLRKIIEIPMAMAMEKVWSKKRILEVYLNIAQWGDGIYGVEAAAKAYFGVTAAHLSSGQAVLMAASLPAPLSRNPAQPSLRQGRLAGAIKARMAMLNKGPSCLFLPQNAVQD